eukprot:TRINITY_DN34575_c0_g1_i1.p1 TRINITY_DN34575_c0_g1~~TRINITY_DN34575_c0_g1_i1.p1  ORF type:complete len:374 (-),score=58.72 TRINITY_DN34575_c0_g1_i1:23-1114(-)
MADGRMVHTQTCKTVTMMRKTIREIRSPTSADDSEEGVTASSSDVNAHDLQISGTNSSHTRLQLKQEQSAAVLDVSRLLAVPAGVYIERAGDPVGLVHIVLAGSVVVEERSRQGSVFVRSIFDGRAFGDFWNVGEDIRPGARRIASYAAQEDSLLLRVTTTDYRAAVDSIDGGTPRQHAGNGEATSMLREMDMFDCCADVELKVVSTLLETQVVTRGERVLEPGQRPQACCIIREGRCRLANDTDLTVGLVHARSWFGIGVLANKNGRCDYTSKVAVIVDHQVAEFWLLGVQALAMLPDSTQSRIHIRAAEAGMEDPIRSEGTDAERKDQKWQRVRRHMLAEERRCSSRGGVPRGVPRTGRLL